MNGKLRFLIGFIVYILLAVLFKPSEGNEHLTIVYLCFAIVSPYGLELLLSKLLKKHKKMKFTKKYGCENIAHSILENSIWVGQTSEQLIDSIGKPHQIEQKQLKTKYQEVWKYRGARQGTTVRVTLNDGLVETFSKKT